MKIMLDLETMSTEPDAAVIAIGAVVFDVNLILGEFEAYINPTWAIGHRSVETRDWWSNQNPRIREKVFGGTLTVNEALIKLSLIFLKYKINEVWANSPSFDCIILRNQYNFYKQTNPWSHRIERDFRTLTALAKNRCIDYSVAYRDSIPHDPLSDARCQARAVQIILPKL